MNIPEEYPHIVLVGLGLPRAACYLSLMRRALLLGIKWQSNADHTESVYFYFGPLLVEVCWRWRTDVPTD